MSYYWTFNNATLCEKHAVIASQAGIDLSEEGQVIFTHPIESMTEFVLLLEMYAAMKGHEIPESLRFTCSETGTCAQCEREELEELVRLLGEKLGGDAA